MLKYNWRTFGGLLVTAGVSLGDYLLQEFTGSSINQYLGMSLPQDTQRWVPFLEAVIASITWTFAWVYYIRSHYTLSK